MLRLLFFTIVLCLPIGGARADAPLRIGLFGVVESVQPLIVAGQTVVLPEGVPVLSPLGPGQEISLGDTLALRTTLDGDLLRAERVLEVYAAAGPVSGVSGDELRLLGTAAHLPPGESVAAGDWLAVSGLWSGAKVITTALRRTDRDGLAQITGTFDAFDPDGRPRVGGSAIFGAALPEGDIDDTIWMLTGRPEGKGLRVDLMTKGLFGGETDLDLWQGHASGPIASETWTVFGTGIYGYDREADMPRAGALVRVCARDGRVLRIPPPDAAPDLRAAMGVLGCG